MEFLDVSHDPLLVAFACAVAFVAGFTGLTLTRSLSDKSERQRKIAITLAAISLGGGIWSMHFVAMLGLQLPILFYYDAAITLASALLAILIVGMALIVLHFLERTTMAILASGALVGVGVLAMHYVGMAGLKLCRAVYTLPGVALSSVAAILLCMLAVWVAYQRRNNRNILLATLCFGVAVASVHFLAMAGTGFVQVPGSTDFGPTMSNEVLAIGVILSSFVIFGACIWVSTTYLTGGGSGGGQELGLEPAEEPIAAAPSDVIALQIPCERTAARSSSLPGRSRSFGRTGTIPRFTRHGIAFSAHGLLPRRRNGCCLRASCRPTAPTSSIPARCPSSSGARTRAGAPSRRRICPPSRSAGQS